MMVQLIRLRFPFLVIVISSLTVRYVVGQCSNCASGTCLPDQTCDECQPGVYGQQCEKLCPYRCKSCVQDFENNEICNECKEGFQNGLFYGTNYTDCSASCNQGCLECNGQPYNCSSCSPGYYFRSYTNSGRCNPCPNKCATCISNTQCTSCYAGSFGNNCQNLCRGNCKSCSSWDMCNECKAGFHGQFCQYQCPKNCKICNNSNTCITCIEGYYGNRCEIKCPTVCGQCDTKKDCDGCPDVCQIKTCSTNCNSCTSNACTSCKPGYFGNHCQNKCHRSCFSCADSSNYCLECAKGYYRNRLQCYNCPQNCDECTYSNVCPVCKPGFYGIGCYYKCKPECHSCTSLNDCTVCPQGFGGHHCNIQCPSNCYHCSDSGSCTECRSGYVGSHCQFTCPSGCRDNICDLHGNCTFGCKSDYFLDEFCLTCLDGKFGKDCQQKCSSNCLSNECDKSDGYCSKGCVNGFFGSQCQQTCSKDCVNKSCTQVGGLCNKEKSMVTLLLFVLIGLVALIGISVIALHILTHCRRGRTGANKGNPTEMGEMRSSKGFGDGYENFGRTSEITAENDNYYTMPRE